MVRNQIHKRALSLLLSLTLVLSVFGVDTAGAFAAQGSGAKNSGLGAMRFGFGFGERDGNVNTSADAAK